MLLACDEQEQTQCYHTVTGNGAVKTEVGVFRCEDFLQSGFPPHLRFWDVEMLTGLRELNPPCLPGLDPT